MRQLLPLQRENEINVNVNKTNPKNEEKEQVIFFKKNLKFQLFSKIIIFLFKDSFEIGSELVPLETPQTQQTNEIAPLVIIMFFFNLKCIF